MSEDHAERGMVTKPMLEDFQVSAPNGAYSYLECPDGDCFESPIGKMEWTIREQIDAATEHNRRYHS